eukprot:6201354-Pleurochrysis_carterae.AAC.1
MHAHTHSRASAHTQTCNAALHSLAVAVPARACSPQHPKAVAHATEAAVQLSPKRPHEKDWKQRPRRAWLSVSCAKFSAPICADCARRHGIRWSERAERQTR